ncbi:sugar ABC transporter substrate-binding protein [Glycomyces harbinensis]|uniref:Multiple sugar transport system substrate-binding protein n=1 Tax=Glycomyces harbinensis TaxID=58114 RepID=A0A1G6UCZ2_9ACTN|nr:extracellular solute-binding protein [Glycomyces harbinensis]SDD39094.1 multiple sugar transport system substrate-binding protein [Glycomyces harbinensis]
MKPTARAALAAGGTALAAALALTGCGQGFDDTTDEDASGELSSSDDPLTILYGASGEAETQALEAALAAWSEESGVEATAVAATNMDQELSQGFASGSPADLFYLAPEALAGYAANGSLRPYGDELSNKDDFYPSLVQNFTVDDEFYCAPKDFSTLALVINTEMWAEAGLTDADLPTTWEQLDAAAEALTTDDRAGLTFGAEYQRVGAFMAQAGGRLVSEDGATAVADSPENLEGLSYVKSHLEDGTFAYAADLGAGWGGEAFGKGLAAMTVEGNWVTGALSADFPDVQYQVVPLPAGPAGPGTLQFTNCWGMAADSPNQQAALDLVEYLTSTEQQLAFSAAFGPMPSIESAADQWRTDNPDLAAFLDGSDHATGVPVNEGVSEVVADMNSQLESLAGTEPEEILATVQSNLEAVVGG